MGKAFDAKKSVLTNRILFLGLNAIIASIYHGASLFDGKQCIVLDYFPITRDHGDHVRLLMRTISFAESHRLFNPTHRRRGWTPNLTGREFNRPLI